MTQRRALVTGADGFLGRAAIKPLQDVGFEVHALVRDPRKAIDHLHGVAVHAADLTDLASVRATLSAAQADTLVHFAWSSTSKARWTTLDNIDWVTASLNLARVFADQGGKRFIGCGSCAEYDWDASVLSEATTALRPATLYGASKAATFLALEKAAPALGLSFAWGRVFFCYGQTEPTGRLLSDTIDSLLAGKPAETSDGLQIRDYLDARDVGAGFAALASSDAQGAFNIARGEGVAVKELVETAAELLGAHALLRLGAIARPKDDPSILIADIANSQSAGLLRSPPRHRERIEDIIAFRRALKANQ